MVLFNCMLNTLADGKKSCFIWPFALRVFVIIYNNGTCWDLEYAVSYICLYMCVCVWFIQNQVLDFPLQKLLLKLRSDLFIRRM